MRKTSRSTVEFSAAELRLLLRVLRLCEQVDQTIGHGPPDGMDAEQAEMAIRGLLERRHIEPLPLKATQKSRSFRGFPSLLRQPLQSSRKF